MNFSKSFLIFDLQQKIIMSKRIVNLKIENCGSYSVVGAIATYWQGSIPSGYITYPHQITCSVNDYAEIQKQVNTLQLIECRIIAK